jgi:flagellar assembly factor FliW
MELIISSQHVPSKKKHKDSEQKKNVIFLKNPVLSFHYFHFLPITSIKFHIFSFLSSLSSNNNPA